MNVLIAVLVISCFAQHAESTLTPTGFNCRYPSVSPSENRILFESDRGGNWDIYTMALDGSDWKQLTNHDSSDRRPDWHPSGDFIVFESDRRGEMELFEMDLSAATITPIPTPGSPVFARYAPDGTRLAFSVQIGDQHSELVISNRDGTGLEWLTDFGKRTYYPVWHPDGTQLAFFSRKDTQNDDDEIYTIDLPSGETHRVTQWPRHNFCPSWSADGQKLAYAVSQEGSRPEIFVMDLLTGEENRITYNEEGDTLPSWMPDGKSILIAGYREGYYRIVRVEL